jgi:hypothetical protein
MGHTKHGTLHGGVKIYTATIWLWHRVGKQQRFGWIYCLHLHGEEWGSWVPNCTIWNRTYSLSAKCQKKCSEHPLQSDTFHSLPCFLLVVHPHSPHPTSTTLFCWVGEQLLQLSYPKLQVLSTRQEQPLFAPTTTIIAVPQERLNKQIPEIRKKCRQTNNSQWNDTTIFGRPNYRCVSSLKRQHIPIPWNPRPRNCGNSNVAYDANEPKFKHLHVSVTERQRDTKLRMSHSSVDPSRWLEHISGLFISSYHRVTRSRYTQMCPLHRGSLIPLTFSTKSDVHPGLASCKL